jgi:predicted metal-binding protein
MGYLLGRLEPTAETARALLDYANASLESRDGCVSYAEWPQGLKGRFIARLPPPGYVWSPGAEG